MKRTDPVAALRSRDPEVALTAIRELRGLLSEREPQVVAQARGAGWTWQAIAKALGRTRSSVFERYRDT